MKFANVMDAKIPTCLFEIEYLDGEEAKSQFVESKLNSASYHEREFKLAHPAFSGVICNLVKVGGEAIAKKY